MNREVKIVVLYVFCFSHHSVAYIYFNTLFLDLNAGITDSFERWVLYSRGVYWRIYGIYEVRAKVELKCQCATSARARAEHRSKPRDALD